MPHFLHFFKSCYKEHFLKQKTLGKAKLLESGQFYFLAGIFYMDVKAYKAATRCFIKSHAYKHLIIVYQKQGLYSKALEVAENHKYYDLGAKLCLQIDNLKKAASFYAYEKPLKAAKLYEKENFYYEAGCCYLRAYEPIKALENFNTCQNPEDKLKGIKEIEEFAITLYFPNPYLDALKVFLALEDYYSALDCAQKLKEPILIDSITTLLAASEAENTNYLLAGKCAENVAPQRALVYYAKGHSYYDMIRLLVTQKEYDKAINVCLLYGQQELAYEIAQTYHTHLIAI